MTSHLNDAERSVPDDGTERAAYRGRSSRVQTNESYVRGAKVLAICSRASRRSSSQR